MKTAKPPHIISAEVIFLKVNKTPSSDSIHGQPSDAFEMVNKYGTYNIQPTADTVNPFPAIAQGSVNPDKSYNKSRKEKIGRS